MRAARRRVACGFAGALLLASGSAWAEPDPITEMGRAAAEALQRFTLWGSLEAGAAAAMTPRGRPAGPMVRASISATGIGLRVAVRDEPVGAGRVRLGQAALELRPLAMMEVPLYTHVDPFVAVGGEAGGGAGFFGAAYVGGGITLAPYLNHEGVGPALTLEYDHRVVKTPDETQRGVLVLGTALRGSF